MSKRNALVCDVDGTVAKRTEDRPDPYDMTRVKFDMPIWPIVDLANVLVQTYQLDLIIVTAREDTGRCYRDTGDWLRTYGLDFDEMFMRSRRDYRADEIVKEEFYLHKIAPHWNVKYVLDDHGPVVDMWRKHGLTCLQVAPGWLREKEDAKA